MNTYVTIRQGMLAYGESPCWSLTITGTWWYQYKITEDEENAQGRSKR